MSAPNPVIGVDVRGVDQVIASLRALGQDITEQVELAVEATALEALTTVRKAIQGPPKTGREYPRGKNGNIIHRASAPGEAPATDTGALAAFTSSGTIHREITHASIAPGVVTTLRRICSGLRAESSAQLLSGIIRHRTKPWRTRAVNIAHLY